MMLHLKIVKYVSLLLLVLTVSGCSSLGYYLDLMEGHNQLLDQQQPVMYAPPSLQSNTRIVSKGQ